jgi:hypothetical protein
VASLDQAGGHGLAHAAKADPADIVRCFAGHARNLIETFCAADFAAA